MNDENNDEWRDNNFAGCDDESGDDIVDDKGDDYHATLNKVHKAQHNNKISQAGLTIITVTE